MAVFTGTVDDDVVVGSNSTDTINGQAGSDVLFGYGDGSGVGGTVPSNSENGGGALDHDSIDGGTGNDVILGGGGADTISGGNGRDLIYGGALTDHLLGGAGADTLYGGGASDVLSGGGDRDVLYGENGNDRLSGDTGEDSLVGGRGNDQVDGGAANDRLFGDDGDDTLTGGGGHDRLEGGAGTDVAVFAGSIASYEIVTDGGATTVRDLAPLVDGDDGTDTLSGVELLRFADGTVPVPTPPSSATLIELGDLDRSVGVRLGGVNDGDRTGWSVGITGDVNGDGLADLIVGAPYAHPSLQQSGVAYVVFGADAGLPTTLKGLAQNDDGFPLIGANRFDNAGYSVSSAGDVNGDGVGDVLLSATGQSASYVVFGSAGGLAPGFGLGTLDGTDGFRISSGYGGSGYRQIVGAGGDVNGDGFDDIVIGIPDADHGSPDDNNGAAFVVFGHEDGFPPDIQRPALNGTDGFRVSGENDGDGTGRSVSSAGDVNGDGFDDIVIGAPSPVFNTFGSAFVLFGRHDGFAADQNLGALDGSNGFELVAAAPNNLTGWSVSAAGDMNGDGFDDLVIGANANGQYSGAAYVVFGHAGGFPASVSLASLDGADGFRISGAAAGDEAGEAVSSAGDVNGDGYDDINVGAPLADPHGLSSGAAYIVFGKASGFAADLDLATLQSDDGVVIAGAAAGDLAGRSVSGGGDVNGDGFDDVIVGAVSISANAGPGAAYVIFGHDFNGDVTHLGTSTSEPIDGSPGADIIVGGLGDDTIDGLAGSDVLKGGGGNDVFVFDAADRQVEGGLGLDTLRVNGAGVDLDLTAINAVARYHRFLGIERIDLTGSGGNTLRLDRADLLHLTNGTGHTLTVDGDTGDTVHAAGGWAEHGIDGGYEVFTLGGATLRVDLDVDVFV